MQQERSSKSHADKTELGISMKTSLPKQSSDSTTERSGIRFWSFLSYPNRLAKRLSAWLLNTSNSLQGWRQELFAIMVYMFVAVLYIGAIAFSYDAHHRFALSCNKKNWACALDARISNGLYRMVRTTESTHHSNKPPLWSDSSSCDPVNCKLQNIQHALNRTTGEENKKWERELAEEYAMRARVDRIFPILAGGIQS